MRFMRLITIVCTLLVFIGCAKLLKKDNQKFSSQNQEVMSPQPAASDTSELKTGLKEPHEGTQVKRQDKDYIIGPDDVLKIQVWDNTDLDRVVQVSREGTFAFPLIGSVMVDGLSVAKLEKELSSRLADGYIKNPQVTITIDQYKSKKVFVLGEVIKPGSYPLTGGTDLLDIIAQAGGHTDEAGNEIIIIRPQNNLRKENPTLPQDASEGETTTIDLHQLLRGDISLNIELQNGDTVYLPKRSYFFVTGEVRTPGRYVLERGTTVLKGITMAGGFTEKASKWRIKVLRERDGKKIKIKAEMDQLVEPEDIISVPESFF
jgi:polysaccharide export outer membrane protein